MNLFKPGSHHKSIRLIALLFVALVLPWQACAPMHTPSDSAVSVAGRSPSGGMGNGDVYTGMRSLMTLAKSVYVPSLTPAPANNSKFFRFIKGQQCSASASPQHAGLLEYIAQQWHLHANQCSSVDQVVDTVTMTDYDPSVVSWQGEIFGQSLQRDDLFTASYPWLWCRSAESLASGLDIVIGEKLIDASLGGDGSFVAVFPPDGRPVPANISFSRADTSAVATYVSQNRVLVTAPIGAPRIEYDPFSGDALGLLIEESRTNVLLRSEALETWTKTGSVVANAGVAPDSASTADSVLGSVEQAIVSNGVQTLSIFAKSNASSPLTVSLGDASAVFDLRGIRVVSSEPAVRASIDRSVNGWVRVQVSSRASMSVNRVRFSSDRSVSLWGAQLEQGAYATSYIATTNSPVTRAQDVVSTIGASLFKGGTGSMDVRFSPLQGPPSGPIFRIVSGSQVVSGDAVDGQFSMGLYDASGATTAVAPMGSVAGYPDLRIAFTIDQGHLTGAISGALRVENAPFNGVTQGSSILFGRDEKGRALASGHLRKVIYWERALSEGTMVMESGNPAAPLPLQGQITIGDFSGTQYMRHSVFNFQVEKQSSRNGLSFVTPDYDMNLQVSTVAVGAATYSGAIDVVVDDVRHQVPLTCVLEKANIR